MKKTNNVFQSNKDNLFSYIFTRGKLMLTATVYKR